VPVQLHGTDAGPIFAGEGDIDAARQASHRRRSVPLPGGQSYVADSSLPPYDADAIAHLI